MDQYPGSTAADTRAILSTVPAGTKNSIINVLKANGLFSSTSNIGIVSETNPGIHTQVDGYQNQLVLLGPNSSTQINSNTPVIIGLASGNNYADISHANTSRDRADTIIGGSGNDTIVGNTAASLLVGGAGNESMLSGGGLDTIRGGSGTNTIVAGGQSHVYGGAGDDTIRAGQSGSAHDTIQAGTGQDRIMLSAGSNTVYAPSSGGAATITAGSGYDTIYGPAANRGTETINGGAHTTLHLDSGAVKFNLGSGDADTIFGGQGTGFVNLNKASTDISSSSSTHVGGQTATTFTFASGGSITTVGNVNLTFTDTRHQS